jgi:hypothetical protein
MKDSHSQHNDFPRKRLADAISSWRQISSKASREDAFLSPEELIRLVVSGGEIMRTATEEDRVLDSSFDELWAKQELYLTLKSALASVSDSDLIVARGESGLISLFVMADEIELVSGFLLQFCGDESVMLATHTITDLVEASPWIFIDIADFVECWSNTFEIDEAMHPLWIQLSQAKFEAVLWHAEEAGVGFVADAPLPKTVHLASIVNTLVMQESSLLAALRDVQQVSRHEFSFSSPDGLLVADLSVPVSIEGLSAELDVVISPKMGRDSSELEFTGIGQLIGKQVRFGGTEEVLLPAAKNGVQATLQVSSMKRLSFADVCLYVNDVPWQLLQ